MVHGFIPTAWRQVKVTFIPKSTKLDYTEAKTYYLISLSAFLLQTMEKLVDRHIRDGVLTIHLHRNQHAYQNGKSTETALHNVVARIGYAIEHKVIALGAFLDIEGAFDRTSCDTIKQAAEGHGIEPAICRWICAMLKSRSIIATLSGETLGASVTRGCPQGGVLSPLLWGLVMDDLLWEHDDGGYYTEYVYTASAYLHTLLWTRATCKSIYALPTTLYGVCTVMYGTSYAK
jgi:hypothetical protein